MKEAVLGKLRRQGGKKAVGSFNKQYKYNSEMICSFVLVIKSHVKNVGNKGVFWAWKRKQQSQRPVLNYLTLEKTKLNFRSCPDAAGRLHLSGTYHHLSRNFPPPTPAQKAYHPLPNYKCHLN